MVTVLLLGNCTGADLYFLVKEKIRFVRKAWEGNSGEISGYDAVVIGSIGTVSSHVFPLKEECRRKGIPLFGFSESGLFPLSGNCGNFAAACCRIPSGDYGKEFFIGESPRIQELKSKIEGLLLKECKIFILGETGTGKEILADLIYRKSQKHCSPFEKINCAAIPPNLAEAQMFGSETGAFTDAVFYRGFLERAHSGMLFLDEIFDLPFELQGKLLRVLEEKEFYRIGGKKKIRAEFHLLCAANRPRSELFRNSGFRRDLFYRISECLIEIPPLRERPEDILSLCRFFLPSGESWTISDSALDKLMSYRWPGNVRELKNVICRSSFKTENRVLCADDIVF